MKNGRNNFSNVKKVLKSEKRKAEKAETLRRRDARVAKRGL